MTTTDHINAIAKAAATRDWTEVGRRMRELKAHLDDTGVPLTDAQSYRLISSLQTLTGGRTSDKREDAILELVRRVSAALATTPRDLIELNQSWESLDLQLADGGTTIDTETSDVLLKELRGGRAFSLLARSSERLLARGDDRPMIRRLYAQALIDEGRIIAAVDLLKCLLVRDDLTDFDRTEVHGLLGRAHKQIYVDYVRSRETAPSLVPRFAPALKAAIQHYGGAYNPATPASNYWHGGNYLALLHRARRDGVTADTTVAVAAIAHGLAVALEPQAKAGDDSWAWATLGEAYLALEDYEKAANCFSEFARHKGIDAFMLAGTIRQLEQVWQLTADSSGPGAILAGLKAIMAQKGYGVLTLSPAERKAIDKQEDPPKGGLLERMLPNAEIIKYRVLRTIVQRGAAVCIIRDRRWLRPIGTGFLINGKALSSKLDDETYLLTNAHVVSDPKRGRDPLALTPEQACVYFEGDHTAQEIVPFTCEPEAVWQSPYSEYDATLLRLKTKISSHIQPLEPAQQSQLEVEDSGKGIPGSRLAVIGHPKGDELSLLLSGDITDTNGTLVDMGPRTTAITDPVYLHYKTPTEPGNSGSPVFEMANWELVGLHHAGFDEKRGLARLGGKAGSHQANEGICIRSISRAIDRELPAKPGNTATTAEKLN